MKLYATVSSERARKGQGGNKYLNIIVTDDNKQEIAIILISPHTDFLGEKINASVQFAEHVYVNGENEFSWGYKKGEKQKGEIVEPWDIDHSDNK